MEILLSPLPQVLIWKAEFSNFLFLFAAIERATLDVDAQQLEVMWLMMLQLDKGGNGKNPADFSECWIKHLLNNLNSSKIPLFNFFLLLIIVIVIVGHFVFLQRGKTFFSFLNLFASKLWVMSFGTRSHMTSWSCKGFCINLGCVALLIEQISPMLMVQMALFSMHN